MEHASCVLAFGKDDNTVVSWLGWELGRAKTKDPGIRIEGKRWPYLEFVKFAK
jgi:hypothetical protein